MASVLTGCSLFGPWSIEIGTGTVVMDGISSTSLTLRNASPLATTFSIESDAGWLRAVPSSGQIGGFQSADVLLVVDKSSTAPGTFRRLERVPGTYPATLVVKAGDVEGTVDVRFQVRPEPTSNACTTQSRSASSSHSAFDAGPRTRAGPIEPDETPSYVILKYAAPGGFARAQDASRALDTVAAEVAAAYGLRDRRPGPGRGVEVARIPTGRDMEAFVRALDSDPRVVYAELDRPLFPQALPNDPALDLQWAPCHVGLPEAWEVSTGVPLAGSNAPKTTIAILDSGVDLDHPDLQASLLPGRDFCPLTDAGFTRCDTVASEPGGGAVGDSHGTHVAGIAAAVGDNGTGIAGVAWGGTRLLPVKVFDDQGDDTYVSTIACAIHWAYGSTDPATLCGAPVNPFPAAIVNLSLGGPGTSPTLNDAIAAATRAGALVFAASGNAGGSSAYQGILMPANAPDAIAVGAVNSNFERSSFSRFDALGGRSVDLMGPGGTRLADDAPIYSTYVTASGTGSCATYCWLAGTSMATPFVAGVAALVWSQEPTLTAEQVRARLEATTYVAPGWSAEEYGSGLVCADAALGRPTACGTSP